MNNLKALFALSAALVVSPTYAQLLLNDSFSDGSHTNQSLTDSARWFNSSSSGVTLNNERLSINAGRHILAYFTPSSPASLDVGQTLKITMDISFLTAGAGSGGFRVGIFNSGGTRASTDNVNNIFDAYQGYAYTMAVVAPSVNSQNVYSNTNGLTLRQKGPGQNGALISTLNHYTEVSASYADQTSPSLQTVSVNSIYELSLMLTRTATDTIKFSFSLEGENLTGFTRNYTVADPTTFSFDTLALSSVSTNGSNFTIDNVHISVIPEPSTYAAIFGALALGFVAWRRRAA